MQIRFDEAETQISEEGQNDAFSEAQDDNPEKGKFYKNVFKDTFTEYIPGNPVHETLKRMEYPKKKRKGLKQTKQQRDAYQNNPLSSIELIEIETLRHRAIWNTRTQVSPMVVQFKNDPAKQATFKFSSEKARNNFHNFIQNRHDLKVEGTSSATTLTTGNNRKTRTVEGALLSKNTNAAGMNELLTELQGRAIDRSENAQYSFILTTINGVTYYISEYNGAGLNGYANRIRQANIDEGISVYRENYNQRKFVYMTEDDFKKTKYYSAETLVTPIIIQETSVTTTMSSDQTTAQPQSNTDASKTIDTANEPLTVLIPTPIRATAGLSLFSSVNCDQLDQSSFNPSSSGMLNATMPEGEQGNAKKRKKDSDKTLGTEHKKSRGQTQELLKKLPNSVTDELLKKLEDNATDKLGAMLFLQTKINGKTYYIAEYKGKNSKGNKDKAAQICSEYNDTDITVYYETIYSENCKLKGRQLIYLNENDFKKTILESLPEPYELPMNNQRITSTTSTTSTTPTTSTTSTMMPGFFNQPLAQPQSSTAQVFSPALPLMPIARRPGEITAQPRAQQFSDNNTSEKGTPKRTF